MRSRPSPMARVANLVTILKDCALPSNPSFYLDRIERQRRQLSLCYVSKRRMPMSCARPAASTTSASKPPRPAACSRPCPLFSVSSLSAMRLPICATFEHGLACVELVSFGCMDNLCDLGRESSECRAIQQAVAVDLALGSAIVRLGNLLAAKSDEPRIVRDHWNTLRSAKLSTDLHSQIGGVSTARPVLRRCPENLSSIWGLLNPVNSTKRLIKSSNLSQSR